MVQVDGSPARLGPSTGSAVVFGLRRLWRHRPALVLLSIVLLGGTALQLIPGLFLRAYLDGVRSDAANTALVAALWFVAVSLIVYLLSVLEGYLAAWLAWTVTNELRVETTAHVLRLDLPFHGDHLPGLLVERIDGDISLLSNFFSRFVVAVVGQGLLLLGLCLALTSLDWRIGLTLAALGAVSFLLLRRLSLAGRGRWVEFSRARATFSGFVAERLEGAPDLVGNGALPVVQSSARAKADEVAGADVSAHMWGSIAIWALTTCLAWLATGSALWWSWDLYTAGQMSLGTAFLVFAYTQQMIRPLDALTLQNQDYQSAAAALGRVRELLAVPDRSPQSGRLSIPAGPVSVEFRSVGFEYLAGAPVLRDVNVCVPAGRSLGIVGRTGSGKSTVARLLSRLYEPTSGMIVLNGVDLAQVEPVQLRRDVGVVTQEVHTFSASVRDNLTFFAPEGISDQALVDVLVNAGAGDWFHRLPEGLDTRVGSGGYVLSTGEEQLLSFARVLLASPRVVVLDEASSRLDPITEQAVQQSVRTLISGRTSIIIAHRLSTLDLVDDVLVLDQGVVVENGDRAALAADPDSWFGRLHRAAADGDNVDELIMRERSGP